MNKQADFFMQGSSFEDDFLIRTIGTIGKNPSIALTELVANAWDAGAESVKIIVPSQIGEALVVEDDGCGMTHEQFVARWMKLGYNRISHQGSNVEFPPKRNNWTRKAYGRNGVGRHGLLCFADSYEVITWRNGIAHRFLITTSNDKVPFVIVESNQFEETGHGTKLLANVSRHLPNAEEMCNILAARFLHDPKFSVFVNGKTIDLMTLPGFIEEKYIKVTDKITLHAFAIDSTKSAHNKQRQGAAFWVNNRLVGEPSWDLGQKNNIDARTQFGRKYTFIFKSDDLSEYILPDWSGFHKNAQMNLVYIEATKYINSILRKFLSKHIQETKQEVLRNHRGQIKDLSPLAKLEVETFLNDIIEYNPSSAAEVLSPAISAVINLEKTRSGKSLLEKLANLKDDDIEALNKLLDNWSMRDALTVLEEIDKRISVIEAIKRLSSELTTLELSTLHPLVTEARWIFGPEFESTEYTSNITLINAVKKLFKIEAAEKQFINPRKRPDLIILSDSTLSVVSYQEFDPDSPLVSIRDILIIELKKGGATIGRKEMNQASEYVQDLLHCETIEGSPRIRAFVVGHKIDSKLTEKMTLGENTANTIKACTYGQLVRTAEMRMFKLRERLNERYENFSKYSVLGQILSEPEQIAIEQVLL